MNKKRTQEYMTRYGLEALIATSPINVSYFTGLDCWIYRGFRESMFVPGAPSTPRQAYAIVPLDGRPVLILETAFAAFAVDVDVREVRAYGALGGHLPARKDEEPPHLTLLRRVLSTQSPTAFEALISVLDELGIKKGRVGIELKDLSRQTWTKLRKGCPNIAFLDCPELIRFIRLVKTEEEIRRLRTVAQINERALMKSLSAAKAGVTFGEILHRYLVDVASDGATYEHFIYSPDGIGTSGIANYSLKRGESVFVDCGCLRQMYYADTGTTLVVGEPAQRVTKRHRAVWEAIQEASDSVLPGVTPSSILGALSKGLERRDIANCYPQRHGIGLETRELPIIAPTKYKTISDQVIKESVDLHLEEGMVINLEAPIFDLGVRSYQVERTFLVGKRSAREITPERGGAPFVAN